MSYKRVKWENEEIGQTPIDAENLNNMDQGIYDIDIRTVPSAFERAEMAYTNSGYIDRTKAISSDPTASTIAKRDTHLNTKVSTPTDDLHAANNEYLNTKIQSKVQKSSEEDKTIYGYDPDVGNVNIPASSDVQSNGICLRDENGTFKVPYNTNGIVSKGYVDNSIKTAKEKLNKTSKKIINIEEMLRGSMYQEETAEDEFYEFNVQEGTQKWAQVDRIYGKSFFFNQLSGNTRQTLETAGLTFTRNDDETYTVSGTCTQNVTFATVYAAAERQIIKGGHKYLLKGCASGGTEDTYQLRFFVNGSIATRLFNGIDTGNGVIASSDSRSDGLSICAGIRVYEGAVLDNVTFKPQIFDLTEIYGEGREPQTVEEFNSEFIKDYYPFNAGYILSGKCDKIVSVDENDVTVSEYPIDSYVINIDGYGESNGDIVNYLDLKQRIYVSYGRYIETKWIRYAAPVITDVSRYLGDDNFVQMIVGGKL